MRNSRIIIITVVVTLIIVAGIWFLFKAKATASGDPTVVRIEQAQIGELVEFVSAPGQIEPRTKVEISAKVSARIIELPYEEGERVTCGDPNVNPPVPPSVLVRLDAKDLESELRSAEAGRAAQAAQLEVDKARNAGQHASLTGLAASLKQAERDLKRQEGLLQSQDISQSTFDEAQSKVDDLKAQYEAAMHALEAAQLNLIVLKHNVEAADARIDKAREALSYTTITSPIDGVVTRINAEVGEVVVFGTMNNPGTVIMEVADLSQMLVVAQVDEADVGKLKLGQEAVIRVQAFWDEHFKGVVDNIALTYDTTPSRAKYFRTEILLHGDVEKLYSGLTADVDIYTKKHSNIIKVPSQAVLSRKVDDLPLGIRENNPNVDPNKSDAMVVYRCIDDKAVVTPVTIGPSDMTHIIIKSGLSEGDKIIVGPYKILEGLKHEQKVKDERQVEAEKKQKEKDKNKNSTGKSVKQDRKAEESK